MKSTVYKGLVLFMFLMCSITASNQEKDEEKGTDYIVVFDVTSSMYAEAVVIPCDFLLCDEDLKEKGNKTIDVYSKEGGYSKEKGFETRIKIGIVALKCYLEHIEQENSISEKDKICLYFIKEEGIELQQKFVKFENKEKVLGKIRAIKEENPEKSLTPLSRALREVMEKIIGLDPDRRYMIIFVTDLNETIEKEGSEAICKAAEEIYYEYSEYLNFDYSIDSIMFQCIAPKYLDEIKRVSECFKNYLPIATLVPISTVNSMSFQAYDALEERRIRLNKCADDLDEYADDLDECADENKTNESEIELLKEQLQVSKKEKELFSKYLEIFRIPLLILMLISLIGIIFGIDKIKSA